MGGNLMLTFLKPKYSFTYLSYKALYSYQTLGIFILFRMVDPFMHYLFFATLATALVGSHYLQYVVVGNITYYTCQTVIINFMSIFRYERRYGTLELNIASPTKTMTIIIKRSIVPFLDGLIIFLIGLLIGHVIFGLDFPVGQTLNLILLIFVSLLSILSLSFLLACVSLLFSNVNLFLNIILGVLQVFCGANFSVTLLPNSLELLARLMPLTHSIEALRTVYELETLNIYQLLAIEILIGITYFILATILVTVMERIARKTGALLKST